MIYCENIVEITLLYFYIKINWFGKRHYFSIK